MQYRNKLKEEDQNEQLKTVSFIISQVVAKYISRRVIPERERGDVEMAITEKYLLKREKIHQAFEGRSKLTTYYTAVVNRMCCEVIRKEQKHWYAVEENEYTYKPESGSAAYDTARLTLLKEEMKRFSFALILFNDLLAKVILFLKYYFEIPIKDEEIHAYAGLKKDQAAAILGQRSGLAKAEVNEKLAELVLLVEDKKVGGDAIRMWTNKQIDILIARMNGDNQRYHNRETITIMLEIHAHSA